MRTSLIVSSLAALAVLILAGNLSRTNAASYTDGPNAFSSEKLVRVTSYQCTATFEKYAPRTYCAEMRVATPDDDGLFTFTDYQASVQFCTDEARGNPPNVQFGVSRDFFCNEPNTGIASIGRVMGNKIKGQLYGQNVVGGVRAVFTCEQVATCP
jgi:hypothetical protein